MLLTMSTVLATVSAGAADFLAGALFGVSVFQAVKKSKEIYHSE